MIVEVMGVRLMAPWFGQSQLVWTHVIGVVLAALAAGQWLGGRWAESGRGPGPAALLLGAAGLSLALPDLVAWLSARILPEDLPLLEAYPFVTMGSLLVSLVCLGLPMTALGAVTPWLVRLSRDATATPARVTGRILAAGTLGSLAGTFGATHVLLPAVGSAGAVRVAGGILAAVGLLTVALAGGRRTLLGLLALVLLPLGAMGLPAEAPLDGLLEELETPYQWARVVGLEDGSRQLLLNEGLDSFHSVWQPTGVLTGLYYDSMLYAAALSPRSEDGLRHLLVVGLAAGTLARQILALEEDAVVRGVELDAAIVELGRRWFELPEQIRIDSGFDGRVVLDRVPDQYGAILVDAYAQQIYLPPHLCSTEFFETVRRRLLPGGVVALNVGGLSVEDPVVAAVAGTFAAVFPGALLGRMPGTRNIIVVGFNGATPEPAEVNGALENWHLLPALAWMVHGPAFHPVGATGGRPLRDGDAPVEALAHESWRGGWEDGLTSSETPSGEPARDLERGRELLEQTRWTGASRLFHSVVAAGTPAQVVEARLLQGNLAFMQDQPTLAQQFYLQVLRSAQQDQQPELRAAAEGNLDLVATSLHRERRLAEDEQHLTVWTWTSVVVFALILAIAGFRAAAVRPN